MTQAATTKAPAKVAVEIDADQHAALLDLASRTTVDLAGHLRDALDAYIADERAFVEEMEAAIREADAGDFATEAEVSRVFAKYGVTY